MFARTGRRLDHRLAHDDYTIARLPPRERLYGGETNRLRIPEILERARELLRAGRHHTFIARELGYADACAFSVAFRAVTGERPRAFQRRAREDSAELG